MNDPLDELRGGGSGAGHVSVSRRSWCAFYTRVQAATMRFKQDNEKGDVRTGEEKGKDVKQS